MTGFKDLFASERGCFVIFVAVVATAMTFMSKMTVDQWITVVQWIGVPLIAGKTVTTAITTLRNPSANEPSSTAKVGNLAENTEKS